MIILEMILGAFLAAILAIVGAVILVKLWEGTSRMYLKIKSAIAKTIVGIANIITWFPIIWKDRSWGEQYFYEILFKKLSLMQKDFEKDTKVVGSSEEAKKIGRCAELANRFRTNWHENEYIRRISEKWGDLQIKFVDDELVLSYPKVVTENDKEECWKDEHELMRWEEEKFRADMDELFNTISKNIRSWWL